MVQLPGELENSDVGANIFARLNSMDLTGEKHEKP